MAMVKEIIMKNEMIMVEMMEMDEVKTELLSRDSLVKVAIVQLKINDLIRVEMEFF